MLGWYWVFGWLLISRVGRPAYRLADYAWFSAGAGGRRSRIPWLSWVNVRDWRPTQGDSPSGVCRVGPTISSLIGAAQSGDSVAAEALFSALYSELHRLAKRELARWGAPASLSVTTLLHEAYLDIAGREGQSFPDQARFMGYAARVMRGLVIDHARSRNAIKRGGEFEITSLKTDIGENSVDAKELSSISDALDQLAKVDPKLAELVDMKFFCGFSFAEIAALENLSERTVQRRWEKARIYLHRQIRADLPL
jgi:RNA polymerase sigma factor (TIGR02999 family)